MLPKNHSIYYFYLLFPKYDENKIVEDTVNIACSVNGKLRNTIKVAIDSDQEVVKEIAMADEKVAKHLEGKEIVKVIVVPNLQG